MFFDKTKYSELESKVFQLLKNNFNSFFKHAIEHLTSEDNEYNRTMYVFSIQAALESLVKLYVLYQYGIFDIIDQKQIHEKDGRLKSQEKLLDMLDKEELKTKGYNVLKDKIFKICNFTNTDKDLISKFQQLRNQIAHMGIGSFDINIVNTVNFLIAKVFNELDFKEKISENYEMENTLKKILGYDLFTKYIEMTSIIQETEKYVAENNDEHSICYCLECGNKTSVYDINSGDIKCYLCGYKVNTYYADVMECPDCFCKSFYYDVLNTTSENNPGGNCPCCGAHYAVAKCDICGEFYIPHLTKCYCN